uniref:RRM domain-containing protein n=1 Tax=Strongyloides papillosus TaxID=174720 RepID=A0A0N5BAX4_STREA
MVKSVKKIVKAAAQVAKTYKNVVMVRNLQWFSGPREIISSLEKFGKIDEVRFFENDQTVGNGGKAMVKFENVESVDKVLRASNIKIDGVPVKIMELQNQNK